MAYQNIQDAIAQLSADESFLETLSSNPEQVKSKFELNDEDLKVLKAGDPSMESATPRPVGYCCCCCLSSPN